jgi:hypothetical protein
MTVVGIVGDSGFDGMDREALSQIALQGGEALGIFVQRPHDGGLVFGRGIAAVLESIHSHALLSGLGAGAGGALRVAPGGIEPRGGVASRFA